MPEKPDGWYEDPDDPSLYRLWNGQRWTEQTMPRAASQTDALPTVAGWFADPHGRHDCRYFDGSAWTMHVSNAGLPTRDSLEPGQVRPTEHLSPEVPGGVAASPRAIAETRIPASPPSPLAWVGRRRWILWVAGVLVLIAVVIVVRVRAEPSLASPSLASPSLAEQNFVATMGVIAASPGGRLMGLGQMSDSHLIDAGWTWCSRLRGGESASEIAHSINSDIATAMVSGIENAQRHLCPDAGGVTPHYRSDQNGDLFTVGP